MHHLQKQQQRQEQEQQQPPEQSLLSSCPTSVSSSCYSQSCSLAHHLPSLLSLEPDRQQPVHESNLSLSTSPQSSAVSSATEKIRQTEKERETIVRRIYADKSLSVEDKRQRIRQVMMGRFGRSGMILGHELNEGSSRGLGDVSASRVELENRTGACRRTYHDVNSGVLGCKHYARKCRMKAACCGQYVGCRLCHAEIYGSDHAMDRTKTKYVACMECGELDMPAAANCKNCGVEFASYYCDKCKFWDGGACTDDSGKGKRIFHCDGCGACRIGKGLGIDNCHCTKCGTCFPMREFHRHKCVERSLEANCPICAEYLADSREEIKFFIRCGHAMHVSCYKRHVKTSFTCPVCKKTWRDMEYVFRQLDKKVEDDWPNMPTEYRNKVSKILCQDCHQRSEARFHFLYHKCGACKSYNTRIVEVYERTAPLLEEGRKDALTVKQVGEETITKRAPGQGAVSGDRDLLIERAGAGR